MISSTSARPLSPTRLRQPHPRPRPGGTSPDGPPDSTSLGSTTVQPMIGGSTIFPTAHQMISNATNSVQLEMYEFENPTLAEGEKPVNVPGSAEQQSLMKDLVDAAARGVKVQVILDASKQKSGAAHNSQMSDYLKSHGVEVLTYPPNTVNIDHVKLLVVDNKSALIGGMNWGNHSPVNHDADVLVQGNAAQDLQSQIFEPDWQFSGGTLDHTPAAASGDSIITPLTTSPHGENGGDHAILNEVINQFNNAKQHAYVEMYTLTSEPVLDAMIAAKQRGVDVKVLLDPSEHSVNEKAFNQLTQAGIPVKWYAVDEGNHQILHAKWGEFDDQNLIIGSGNWSANGLGTPDNPTTGRPSNARHNHEADVLVRDGNTASTFDQQFNEDWNKKSLDAAPALHGYYGGE